MFSQHHELQLKNKLIFTGEIQNREQLYEWYNRAKIFCMTSWKESFCHSIGEALYFGNYIIGTEGIVSMRDLTDNGKYGITLKADDDKAMSQTLQKLINDQTYLKNTYLNTVNYAHNNFTWSNIVKRIYNRIETN
jgi:glycosyltransferase involved in cell wall biosynthesis